MLNKKPKEETTIQTKVYTRNDFHAILFSSQKKRLSKMSKWLMIALSLYSFGLLTLVHFLFNDSLIKEIGFLIGIAIMSSFIYVGFTWMNSSPFNVKKERIWFIFMCIVGGIVPILNFASDALSVPHAIYFLMFMLFNFCLILREISKIKFKSKTESNFGKRYISLALYVWIFFALLIGFLFVTKAFSISTGMIWFIGLFASVMIVLVVYRSFTFKRTLNLFGGISSSNIIPLSALMGVLGWMVIVYATRFGVGPIIGGLAGAQVVIFVPMLIITLKGKDEFETHFVKSFVVNIALLIECVLAISAKTIAISEKGSFLNVIILVITTIILYIIFFLKDIQRAKKYVTLEVIGLNFLLFASIGLGILQDKGTLDVMSKDVDIQATLLAGFVGILFINIFISSMDWRRALRFTKKEKTWI